MSKNEQKIALEINEKELNFTVNREIFNKFANEMQAHDKIRPSHNFLVRSVDEKSKSCLLEFLEENAGSEIDIAGALASEYKSDVSIVVKKRS